MESDRSRDPNAALAFSSAGPRFSYTGSPLRPPSPAPPLQQVPPHSAPVLPQAGPAPNPSSGQSAYAQAAFQQPGGGSFSQPPPYGHGSAPPPQLPPYGQGTAPPPQLQPPVQLPPQGSSSVAAEPGRSYVGVTRPPVPGQVTFSGAPGGPLAAQQFQKHLYGAPPSGVPPASFLSPQGPPPPTGSAFPSYRPPGPPASYNPPGAASSPVPMGAPPSISATSAAPSVSGGGKLAGPPPGQPSFGHPGAAQSLFGPPVAPSQGLGQDLRPTTGPPPLGSRYAATPPPGPSMQYGATTHSQPPHFVATPATYGRNQTAGYGPPSQISAGHGGGAIDGPPTLGSYPATQETAMQPLSEDFQSLPVVPAPGAMDAAIDPAMLPRPSDQTEPTFITFAANCHPRFMRLTTNAMPNSHSLLARWHLPLGTIVHPFAEPPKGEEIPVVNFGASNIIRCRRCRTYINPYVVFLDSGRRWRCNVCALLNDVPAEYFCALDESGRRRDAAERPELSKGSIEFLAPAEYMVRAPMPPVYFFLIDVSFAAVKSGLLQVVVETIKSSLDKLPGFPRTQIGFLTFDSTLHFHMLKATLTQPQMMVVGDLDDPFLPVPDDLLVNLSESRKVVEALLDSLPAMFQSSLNIESALGPALRATFALMNQLGGKLLIFQSTLPSLGHGRLKLRGDDGRIYGTEREYTLRGTEDQFYKQMAADFSKCQIGVNLYAFSERYTDLASLGTLCKYTGGQVYFYPGFQAPVHGEKLRSDLSRDLTRETAWEAVMRIRCGKGLRFSTFHGHFMLRSTDLLALPAVDCDKAFGLQIALEDTLLTTPTVYFQVALLYTSSSGERRIRVHTMATPVVAELGDMYRSADCGATVGLLSRLAMEKTMTAKLEDARQMTQLRLVRSFREYRNLYGAHRTTGRLIYPESLKLLPLYTLAICKSLALRGSFLDAQPDERSACGYEFMTMPVSRVLKFLYPSLHRVDEYLTRALTNVEKVPTSLPAPLPLSAERLDSRGAYILDDGFRILLWLGKVLSSDVVVSLLGPEAAQSPDLSKVVFHEQNNLLSKRFSALLRELREYDPATFQPCVAIGQGDQPREGTLFLSAMVEDRAYGFPGYMDWMVQTYRQVLQKS